MALESPDGMSSSESVGLFGQIGDSIKGILTGFVLFPLSIFVIYQVETCEQASEALKGAVPASQSQPGSAAYITGTLSADPVKGEFVKTGQYIHYTHSGEVLAWVEEVKEEGSGTNKKKVRTCKLEWTSSPKNPRNFELSGCKSKPFYQNSIASSSVYADGGRIKGEDGKTYSVGLDDVEFTSEVPSRSPSAEELESGLYQGDGYVFFSEKCMKDELEGCERVSVSVMPVPTEAMTFIGSISGSSIGKFTSAEGNKFLNASVGDFNSTMKDIASDDSTKRWIGRFIAFIMMFSSFNLLIGPVTTLLSFIPFLGDLGKAAIQIVLGVVAFVITGITILLVKFWYIWLILGVAAIGYAYYRKKQAAAA
ncbi:hypothetical protein CH373_08585 [Leptospira perolatii]|uniref:PF07787 family protein n=1 Tax=Leptospira perolatii TaxID=2023191 RepID=A0A2M9ZNI6_9LEPT|nr:TMEM43 family protein [Leptospira perolatii]PJZ69564.1 hypothetical protein CH360_09730 [Leptospira perolatii]PJZ73551.1 hypothetical protein CH373_08585 [Leptospira perolatii]